MSLRTLLVENAWEITYPDSGGVPVTVDADCEHTARAAAAGASRLRGWATVTDQDGLVATYVSGVLLDGAA